MENQRIAIIGGGPSGLSVLRAFEKLKLTGEKVPKLVCFEKQSKPGGLWNFDWRTGIDENGDPLHSSMYQDLRLNVPKEYHEYAGYTYDQHFGKPMPSFLNRQEQLDYVLGHAKHYNVLRYIRCGTSVQWVSFCDRSNQFTVQYKQSNKQTGEQELDQQEFDYVFVAVGHYSTPIMPEFKGISNFQGTVYHSHDFRQPATLKGKRVLLIGGSWSAEDLAMLCYKHGASETVLNPRSTSRGLNWPKEIREIIGTPEFTKTGAKFQNGEEHDFDIVILCTGYKLHYPFMEASLRLNSPNLLYPKLYKGLFWNANPKVIYMGMQNQINSLEMFEAQAFYARDVIQGLIKLPSEADRVEHTLAWMTREQTQIKCVMDAVHFQADYCKEILSEIGPENPRYDFDKASRLVQKVLLNREKDIMTYKDKQEKSLVTGTQAIKTKPDWLKDFAENESA